jgi:hypothetical protein
LRSLMPIMVLMLPPAKKSRDSNTTGSATAASSHVLE